MKRPLFFCMTALLFGIYVSYLAPDAVLFVPLVFLALVLISLACFRKCSFAYGFMIFFFLFGAVYMQQLGRVEKHPFHFLIDEYVTVTADVIEDAQNDDDGDTTLTVRIVELSFLNETFEGTCRANIIVPKGERIPAFGQRFQAICLLSAPSGGMNRNSFDYSLYLKSKQILFVGTVEPNTLRVTGTFPLTLSERIYQLNRRCGSVLSRVFPQEAAAILRALALGDKSQMSDDLKEALQVSGLSHMTAVSGMHVTTLLMMLYALLSVLRQNQYKYYLPLVGVVLLFMLFTGASPSVVRASVMSILALVAFLVFRKADSITSLGVAAGLIVLVNPFAVFDTGFLLSFVATLGILLFAPLLSQKLFAVLGLEGEQKGILRLVKWMITILCVTLSAQVVVLPFSTHIFGTISLWGMITNLLVAPLLPVALVCGLAVGFLGLVHPMLTLPIAGFSYPFIKLLLWIVHGFGSLKVGILVLGGLSVFGAYLCGLCILLFYQVLKNRRFHSVVLGVAVSLLLICAVTFKLVFPVLQLTFVNVGQGDCALLQLPNNKAVLIDGGGVSDFESDYDVGRRVVLPYLQKKGIAELDLMIASHPHSDHIGGLLSIMEEMPVEVLMIPIGFEGNAQGRELTSLAKQKGTQIVWLKAGQEEWLAKDCMLEVLMPTEAWLCEAESENDCSLVFRIRYGNHSLLFMGDLESTGEVYMTNTWSDADNVTVLKVPHHGSEDSSSEALLQWAKPQYAYISCGKNHYGHPAEPVLKRLHDSDVTVYRANDDKDVTFRFTKTKIQSITTGGETP